VLNWRPRYAEIAASGDFGYTCGPWTFQPKTINDRIVATGYFFTVWHKTRSGDWKFILDVGTDAGPMMMDTTVTKIFKEKGKGSPATLRDAERKFIRLYKEDTAKAYVQYISDKVVLAREGKELSNNGNEGRSIAAAAPGKIVFTYKGSGVAPSGDLGYTFGSAELAGKKETWLRIWRHEVTGWKIAVQLIRL
jgi:ketosteroid isomerase-like protein